MKNKFKSYTELVSDSVEWWAKALDEEPRIEMSDDQMKVFSSMFLHESEVEADEDGAFAGLLGKWNVTTIIHRRLQCHTFTMSKAAILACSMLATSPGQVVIMLNFFQYRCHLHGIRHIGMRELGFKIIPHGWFSESTLSKYWDKQKFSHPKDGLLNMLDYPQYAESIRTV